MYAIVSRDGEFPQLFLQVMQQLQMQHLMAALVYMLLTTLLVSVTLS